VTERQQVCAVMTIGAAVGAVASYLFFTEYGSALRRRLLPALDEFEHELNQLRGTVARTAGIASDSWRALNEAIAEATPPPRAMNPHQTSPF
jgi:gas vesicle protein